MTIRWDDLDQSDQLALARAALDRAIVIVASRAETLAGEMENGSIADIDGPDALRLFATITRCASATMDSLYSQISHGPVGHG